MYVIIACKSNSFIGFSVFFHYLFLHLPSHSKRNSDVDMQALLNDIELDIQELKYLMEIISREPDSVWHEEILCKCEDDWMHYWSCWMQSL